MTSTDRLSTALAGRYLIERRLGEGGMATVYLADDLKHKRKVAIKVLRPELAAVLGADRFVQEITTTAGLQHPHILPLFDSGTADGFLYYVMPYIEGETLREKLNRETQLSIDEAVKIATEVADALDYAHRSGVIHRDIKPENILLHDGRPVVADFGIALAVSAAAGGRMTETGMSLGTPHYMSPEQATAEKDLTNRSDVYSLGAVLYEMLTGEPPHMGTSAQAIIMKIVTEPAQPVTKLRKSVPPNVAAAVGKALEKLPADRFESAKAFVGALTDPGFTTAAPGTRADPSIPASRRLSVTAAGWILAGILGLALAWSRIASRPAEPARSLRFALSLGNTTNERLDLDISPDGKRIVQAGEQSLIVRDLGSLEPGGLSGTPGTRPRVSPDGRWIAYSSNSGLHKVPIEGGTPTTLSEHCNSPDWIDDAVLVCLTDDWGIGRVSSAGGPVEPLTVPDTASGEIGHWALDAVPGGRVVLFTSYRRPASRIEAYDLRSGQRSVLVENAVMARYARSGHLLYVRDNALFAVRFDPDAMRTSGSAVPVLEDVASLPSDAEAGFAISDNGTLVAVRKSEWRTPNRLVWVDRRGVERPAIAEPGQYASPRLSPDQARIVLTVTTNHRDLWVYDVRRSFLAQLTRSPASAFSATWTPDGRTVVFTNETPSYDIYRVLIDGSAPPVPVVANVKDKYPTAVSRDGAIFAYEESWAGSRRLILAPLDGHDAGRVIGDSSRNSFDAAFSPNGRWIAYSEANPAGGRNVFVRRTDGTGGKVQVSAGPARDTDPRWTKGGREIAFRRGNAVLAVDIDMERELVGSATMLFDGPYPADLGYDVTPDGARFVMVRADERPGALPILVITNFFEELRRKVGG